MSQHNQSRGRFGGRGNVRSNGCDGERDSGRFGRSFYQLNYVYHEENFMFDIYPNRVETVSLVIA